MFSTLKSLNVDLPLGSKNVSICSSEQNKSKGIFASLTNVEGCCYPINNTTQETRSESSNFIKSEDMKTPSEKNIGERFFISSIKLKDNPYVIHITAKQIQSIPHRFEIVEDTNISSLKSDIMLKSDKEKYDNHIRKLKGSFENPMIKSKGVETKGLDILTILNENSRYDGNSHSNYSCNDELNMTLQEGLNPNFIAALTSEDQYIEFKHALGFFNKKDNAICFYFSRGESVKLKLNEKGLLLRSSGKSLNMLKIFDAGILKPRLANRMRIDIRDVIEDTEPVELKIVNSNGFIRLLEIVLKKVRDLYKGSQYKSTNKIRNHLSSDVEDERHRRLNVARNETENLDINLIKSIELETGNCGEMAHIALAICQKYKLNPLLIEYDTKEGFSHTVCGVSVDGSMYILDPWANILSEDNKHRTMLESKLSKWNSVGKLVIKPFNATSTSESSPKGLDGLPVSPGEAQSLVVTGRFNYTYDIVSNSFIDFIEKKLAQKLTKLYLEKDALQEM